MDELIVVIPAVKSEGSFTTDSATNSATASTSSTAPSSHPQGETISPLSKHKVIGIAVGMASVTLILLGGVTMCIKRKFKKETNGSTIFPPQEGYGKPELDTSLDHVKYELKGAGRGPSQLDAVK